MSGHSKWTNIKFRKADQDARRCKLFTKITREITVAARTNGRDPNTNPRLRTAIDKALAGNMTRNTIDRAIKRGINTIEYQNLVKIRYEGYGISDIAILVFCTTKNQNRTISEVQHIFSKYSGILNTDGSIAYLFKKLGKIVLSTVHNEERILKIALDANAQEVESQSNGSIEIQTQPKQFDIVLKSLKQASYEPLYAKVTMVPLNSIFLDKNTYQNIMKLIDALKNLEDVQNVYSNAKFANNVRKKTK